MSDEAFFVNDVCVLFTNFNIFPSEKMSKDQKLNALARLSLAIAGILYLSQYENWLTFLVIAILIIVLLKYATKKDEPSTREDFTLVPTYSSPDMHTTTVSPLFAEEWQVYPPTYDTYTNTTTPVHFEEPLTPQSYPYGQYLTRTNLLPSDEYATRMLNGGQRQAREYVNSAFTRHEMAHRENMTRLYKKKLDRRFRHNTGDTFSPFHSY